MEELLMRHAFRDKVPDVALIVALAFDNLDSCPRGATKKAARRTTMIPDNLLNLY